MRKKILAVLVTGMFFVGMAGTASADNIARNSTVTLNGVFFDDLLWAGGTSAAPGTLVDGDFLTERTQWNEGTVYWNEYGNNTGQSIQFDLDGTFVIDSFIAQLDNNDAYTLSYWDLSSSIWQTAWDIPQKRVPQNFGMTTRPDADQTTAYSLGSAITTNALMLEANIAGSEDRYFAVSEIQAFGTPVPEPATMFLFGTGLLGLAGISMRRRKK